MTYDKLKDPRHVEPVLREKWDHEIICWYCEPPEKGKTVILTTATSFRRKARQAPVLKIFSWVYEDYYDTKFSSWGDPPLPPALLWPRYNGYPKLKR